MTRNSLLSILCYKLHENEDDNENEEPAFLRTKLVAVLVLVDESKALHYQRA